MTDSAIAEHIVYLTTKYQQNIESLSYASGYHLIASAQRNTDATPEDLKEQLKKADLEEIQKQTHIKQLAIDLVDRIQATLENRESK